MRWSIIFVLCLAVASAKYGRETRFGRMLQSVADLGNDIERDLQDTWSDDDLDESEEDEDVWQERQEPQRHHYLPRQKKQQQKPCATCGSPKRQAKWNPEDEDDEYESREREDYTQKKHKKHQRLEREEDEPKKQCHPNYDLLHNLDQLNAQLASKLHREAKQINDDKNTVVSPVAVQLTLAAIAQGTRGNTKRQITQLLDLGMPKNQYRDAYAALTQVLKGQGPGQSSGKSVQIKSTTNLVLGQESAQEQFIEAIKTCFDGEVKKCDFRQKHQQCREQINQWLAGKTGEKLHHPLSQNELTRNTKMISIGTMQLKANWGKQFRKNQRIAQGQFYALGDQKPTPVKVLETEGDFNYFEDEQTQVLGVQTQEKQLTVYVILPKDRHGLSQVEKQRIQQGQQLQQLLDRCDSKKQTLKVQLPTFQIVHKMDTKQMLRKLGVEDAFDDDVADFSGVTEETEQKELLLKHGRRHTGGLEDIDARKAARRYRQEHHQLHLNKLIQLATIQVDENGIDAANDKSRDSGRSKQPKSEEREEWRERSDGTQFQADHAFAFVVKHNPSNQLLLVGRVIDAAQKAEDEPRREESESE